MFLKNIDFFPKKSVSFELSIKNNYRQKFFKLSYR